MFNWKLKDVIMVSIFSVIFSFIYLGAVYFANFLATILAPFGLAPFAYEILFGVWFMASTFVPYIVQRSGVAVVSEVLSALIEVIMGNMFGPIVILSGIIQGMGPELVFAKNKYRNFSMMNMCLAAAVLFCWQGAIYLFAGFLSAFLSPALLTEISIIGGILIASSGISILGIKDCKTMNMLPSLLVPIIWFLIRSFF